MMMMMMMHPKPTVYVPQFPSSYIDAYTAADEESDDDISSSIDVYSSDEFRMYEFKIRRCVRGRAHDWTECPFAHPGEKARRRDPRRFTYTGTACPDFRKGTCRHGDSCDMAHGVFECWLHPARYRTQPCKDGTACRRRVCFFAHTPDQLRVLSLQQQCHKVVDSYDGSPLRSPKAVDEVLVGELRRLQIEKGKSSLGSRGTGFCSSPTTPTSTRRGYEEFVGEEFPEERVESGRALRARMYERLMSREALAGPDVGWVSELVK